MKRLLTNKNNAYGLVLPDEGEKITEIGLFGVKMLYEILDFCKTLEKMSDDYDTESYRFGFMENKDGLKLLAIQPRNLTGAAWVVLAPRVSAED